jgi:hypothetical protein
VELASGRESVLVAGDFERFAKPRLQHLPGQTCSRVAAGPEQLDAVELLAQSADEMPLAALEQDEERSLETQPIRAVDLS